MRRILLRAKRAVADAVNSAARALGYYPVTDMFAMEQRFVGAVDAKRTDNELLRLTVNQYEAHIEDIRAARDEVASLPPDAPPPMLRHAIKRHANLLDALIVGVERRVAARERAMAQHRGSNGRFVLGDGR